MRSDHDAPGGRKPGRRAANAIPIAIALVILFELALRVAAPKLRDPLLWPDWEAQHKVAAMDRLAGRPSGVEIVFVGSSMVNAGIDPARASRSLGPGRVAFNAALNGADLRVVDLWTRNVVVPRLRPKVVVVGFNAGEANDSRGDLATLFVRFEEAPLGRVAAESGGVLAEIDGWFVENVYIARYRSVLRRPVDALFGEDAAQRRQMVGSLGRLLALPSFQRRPYSAGLSGQLGNFERMLVNYRVGGTQLDALQRLADHLRERGTRLVLVRMPVTDDLLTHFPRGESDRRAFIAALDAFASRNDLPLIDAETRIRARDAFVDPLHLSTGGMQQLTDLVMHELESAP